MSAVTIIGKKVKISFSYDTITIYPREDAGNDIHNRCRDAQIQLVAMLFGIPPQMARVIVRSKQGPALTSCLDNMQHQTTYDRPIHRDDPDHAMYHMDNINIDEDHYHVKFKRPFSRSELELSLRQLVKDGLISDDEFREFFANYDNRQARAFDNIGEKMTGDVAYDTRIIITQVTRIQDNEVIAALHDHLVTQKRFAHVMRQEGNSHRGVAADGKVVNVASEWADIEKAMSLQMVENLRHRTTMETRMRSERANQFQSCHAFFGLKRNTKHVASSVNNVVLKLVDGDEARLDAKYNKHMNKFIL